MIPNSSSTMKRIQHQYQDEQNGNVFTGPADATLGVFRSNQVRNEINGAAFSDDGIKYQIMSFASLGRFFFFFYLEVDVQRPVHAVVAVPGRVRQALGDGEELGHLQPLVRRDFAEVLVDQAPHLPHPLRRRVCLLFGGHEHPDQPHDQVDVVHAAAVVAGDEEVVERGLVQHQPHEPLQLVAALPAQPHRRHDPEHPEEAPARERRAPDERHAVDGRFREAGERGALPLKRRRPARGGAEVVQQEPREDQVLVLDAVAAEHAHHLLDGRRGQRRHVVEPPLPAGAGPHRVRRLVGGRRRPAQARGVGRRRARRRGAVRRPRARARGGAGDLGEERGDEPVQESRGVGRRGEGLAAPDRGQHVAPGPVVEPVDEGLRLRQQVAGAHLLGHLQGHGGAVQEREVGGAEQDAAVVVAEPGHELEAVGAAREAAGEIDGHGFLPAAALLLLLLLLHQCPQPPREGAHDALLHCIATTAVR
uniref:Uncharacterized protein n=1 Tax=Zea mays TaxID=4577 RepID=A0A804M8C0_MAIZE